MSKQQAFEPIDSLKDPGATELAARITNYWYKLGYHVNVRIEKASNDGKPTCFIRSDLLNGWPRLRVPDVREAA